MKNRFIYAILLVSAMNKGALAQEMPESQEPAGPQPHEMLPSSVMDENLILHEAPAMPEPPQPSEPEITLEEEDFMLPESHSEMTESSEPQEAEPTAEPESEQAVYQEPMQVQDEFMQEPQQEMQQAPMIQPAKPAQTEKKVNINLTLSFDETTGEAAVKSMNVSQ